MIDITVQWNPSETYWSSTEIISSEIVLGRSAWVYGSKELTSIVREYSVHHSSEKKISHLQTASIHGRSCYLGSDNSGYHYFSKGIGWVLSDGWKPELGSLGILPLWAAIREKEVATILRRIGLNVVEPVSIEIHSLIPHYSSNGTSSLNSNTVLDLDGSLANPSMYVYRSKSRWRLSDLFFLEKEYAEKLFGYYGGKEKWLSWLISSLSHSVGLLHRNGGYDYSLSSHNVFIGGERLDFEYVVVNELPHRDKILNQDPTVWIEKELYGLKILSWEISEFLNLDWSSEYIDSLIKTEYERISRRKFTR